MDDSSLPITQSSEDASASAPAETPPVSTPTATEAEPKWPGQQSRTNMGWGSHLPPGKDWSYTIISEELFDSEFRSLAKTATELGGRADSVSFQPFDPSKNQDRVSVQEWALKDGTWTFAAVFDGHGGDTTVQYIVEALPAELKGRLASLVSFATQATADAVSATMQDAITSIDSNLARDLLALFPGGVNSLGEMSDEDIQAIINDKDRGAVNICKVLRAQHGSTALLVLQDPSRENIWIAGLGDCSAILVSHHPSGEWKGELLTEVHNGLDKGEVERVRAEHPGEEGALMGYRVLNTIMVTRAIGDHAFKMPRTVVERVFLNADPPMKTNAERVENWVPRILTPPYLTHTAAIQHRKLAREHDRFLVLASDGLTDVLSSDSPLLTDAHIQGVAQAMGQAEEGAPLASQLLKYAMGGSDMAKTSQYLTVDMEGKAWMDDTTVVCLKL